MLIEIAFLAVGAWILISAIMVLMTRELVHAAVWLASMMVGVAGIFITLGAEFLATIQILVYVGAVITLILFTVMLTVPEEKVDFLDEVYLPPGVTIEKIDDLQKAVPAFGGVGPYKDLDTTNPRRPLKAPPTLYGVSLADNEYGTDQTDRSKEVTK
jgi:NADH-quinone oxidoreductase subunit J